MSPSRSSRVRILLVEDNPIDQRAFRSLVTRNELPYDLTVAGSFAEGRGQMLEGDFDIVFSDYQLGDGLGTELLKDAGDTPVVITTGSGDEETAAQALREGAYDYLVKDTSMRHLALFPGTVQRVLARKRAERREEEYKEELARSNAELEAFAYVVSHDLKAPLRNIRTFSGFLQEDLTGHLSEEHESTLTRIVSAADRMSRMIDDLLCYSRVGTDEEVADVDAAQVLRGVLADMSVAVEESEGVVDLLGKMPSVRAAPARLGQVFQNLVANALKFRGEAPPEIRIEAIRQGEHWEFSVADNGIGIAAENQNAVFQVFKRLHSRESYEGSGIGLATCKKIVEHHGGRIWLESEQGRGTTFHFTLPAGQERPAGSVNNDSRLRSPRG